MIIKLISFIRVNRKNIPEIQMNLRKIEAVVKILMISGEADILIEIHAQEGENMVNIIEQIEKIHGITEIHSHFIMDEWNK